MYVKYVNFFLTSSTDMKHIQQYSFIFINVKSTEIVSNGSRCSAGTDTKASNLP